jgi:hypothetical protein
VFGVDDQNPYVFIGKIDMYITTLGEGMALRGCTYHWTRKNTRKCGFQPLQKRNNIWQIHLLSPCGTSTFSLFSKVLGKHKKYGCPTRNQQM